MLLAIDQHFKFSAGTHQMDLNIVHYVTTDDILHKRVFFKPPVVLVIPLNDPMYRYGISDGLNVMHSVLMFSHSISEGVSLCWNPCMKLKLS